MGKTPRRLLTAIGALALLAVSSPGFARELTLDERVEYQRAIEQVYWNHRVWPPENPTKKPPLSAVMPDAALRAKVEDYLKKSNALAKHWQRPVTSEQLQAEMDRMARDTRDGATLLELFHALNDDPYVIAETLARQTQVDRLIHNWYSVDTRFHGEVKAKAEAALASCHNVDCMESMGGSYQQGRYELREAGAEAATGEAGDRTMTLDAEEWQAHLKMLTERFEATAQSLPTNRLSDLEETPDGFAVTAIMAQGDGEITTASVVWPKRSFESWWEVEARSLGSETEPSSALFESPSVSSTTCTNNTWSATNVGVPDSRFMHSAVWTGAEMIIWGGYWGDFPLDTGGRYDPSTDTWTATATGATAPPARRGHTAVWTGTQMIVWGGNNFTSGTGGTVYFNTGGRYAPSTNTWTATSTGTGVPAGREYYTAVWTGSQMIIWGGFVNGEGWSNTGGRYSPSTNTWSATSTSGNVPGPRFEHTALWTGTEMIVWGGHVLGPGVPLDEQYLNTGGRYNPTTNSWTATSMGTNLPTVRTLHSAVWTGTEMIVWGGYDGQYQNTGGRYNPTTNTWTPTSTGTSVPAERRGHTAVWTGTEMIVWGGHYFSQPNIFYLNTGGRYDPATDTWTATSTGTNLPAGREYFTAVWTGTEMIVWGGAGGGNSGGRYNPATDAWASTSTVTIPTARFDHTAVWTGTEMIVWGGQSGSGSALSTGGRYLPATGAWAFTSTQVPPALRVGHTAVWTGTAMIVWGGNSGSSYWNTGGRYNPTNNTWSSTSIGTNVPAARSRHTAVWTGTAMIVWGGQVSSTAPVNTGASYDPTTNTWTPTSTGTNVPAARYDHTAVWTGTAMIVWGGLNSSFQNTGGRYNPTSNAWAPTSVAAAPTTRSDHTAVWSGTEMIVWGGYNFSYSNAGGRYNPTSDTWTATSIGTGVPAARSRHTAVWTGAEMIVWGGENASAHLSMGGRYNTSMDAWTPTASGGLAVPQARDEHTAVWTGRQMIIWGGDPVTATGGAYCACPDGAIGYRDADGDGLGDPGVSVASCDGVLPPGYVSDNRDCRDADPSIGAFSYRDADGDRYGDPGMAQQVCGPPAGYVFDSSDCDDTDLNVRPGAFEVCDGKRNDCLGAGWPLIVDGDHDDTEDACDNCRLIPNSDQTDVDSDRVGDVCDNCLHVQNPSQGDLNHDGVGDNCDLNDGALLILIADPDLIEWQQESGPTSWNVYEGDLDVLRAIVVYTQAPGSNPLADRHCGVTDTYVQDLEAVSQGKVKFALVTGMTGGVEGSLGTNGSGVERPNANPCP